jgi:type III pantothenate kinase
MILCFDVGNTNVVLGIVEEKKVIATFRFITNYRLTEDEYYQKIHFVTKEFESKIDGAIISSVVPAMDNILVETLKKYYHINPILVGPGLKSGLKIKIDNPKTLGADLLCDCVSAYEKYGGPIIVCDLGTATKLLVVNEKKEYLGGIICAGIKGSLESLVHNAAQLSSVVLKAPTRIIAKETNDSIQCGLVVGHAVMIDGLIKKIKAELGTDDVKVVLTGGLASTIKPLLETKVIDDSNLVIDGLISIYYKNNQ